MPETFLSIDALLERMVARSASDLHVTVGTPPAMRVNGALERYQDVPDLSPEDTHQMLYRILSTEQQKVLEINRQIDFAHSIPGLARFRVNVFFQRGTLGAAFRLIPADIKTLEELGIPTALHALTEKPRGLVLVTGPTGSGKSTTLAALIDEINRKRSEHILTIEDPVEFVHRHKRCIVNQREIGPDASSFAEALRAALREDPDVILRGEHGRPDHRRFPGSPAGAGARAARRYASRNLHPGAAADSGRHGPGSRARDPLPRRRGPEPDPAGEGRAGLLGHADRYGQGNADDGAVARRPRDPEGDHARGCAEPLQPPRAAVRPVGTGRGCYHLGGRRLGESAAQRHAAGRGGITRGRLEQGSQALRSDRPKAKRGRRAHLFRGAHVSRA